jgi:hypothetical protein
MVQAGLVGWSEVEEDATVIPEYTWTFRHHAEANWSQLTRVKVTYRGAFGYV